jgi:Gram-negative bacterial TonB protein C-terminal/PilZ domain
MPATVQPLPDSPRKNETERRFYPRVVPAGPIYLSLDEGNDCLLLNASENGLLLSTPTALQCNSVARLAMPLTGLPKPLVVTVRVVWSSDSKKLAGLQLMEISDRDRQQIRKWQTYASRASLHPEAQRDVQQPQNPAHPATKQFPENATPALATTSALPAYTDKKVEDVFKPKPHMNALRDAAPIAATVTPSPPKQQPVIRNDSSSSISRIAKWVVPSAVALLLIGVLLFKSGAMEHSFAHSNAILQTKTVAPLTTPQNEQTPESREVITRSESTTSTASINGAQSNSNNSGTATIPSIVPPREASSKPRAASASAATRTLKVDRHAEPDDSTRVAQNAESASDDNDDVIETPPAESADTPASSAPDTANSTAAPPSVPAVPAKEPPTPTRIYNASPNMATTPSARANPVPVPLPPRSAPARDVSPLIEMDPPARQMLEVHVPNKYRGTFLNVPGEKILETASATFRMQRSVRLPASHFSWTFHHETKIAVGGLIARMDPQETPLHSGRNEYVRVHATINQDGHVESVKAVGGSTNLAPMVVKAVQGWRYQPTLVDGKPVETQAEVTVQFRATPNQTSRQ